MRPWPVFTPTTLTVPIRPQISRMPLNPVMAARSKIISGRMYTDVIADMGPVRLIVEINA
jgi:hypothetical protein